MAGLTPNTPIPTSIVVHSKSRELAIEFSDGAAFRYSFEFLRVNSPSAEVQGHSPDQAVLQYGKQNVTITDIEQVGNYAIQPTFSDGHASGIYSWDYLYRIGRDHDRIWAEYLTELQIQGLGRTGNDAPPPPKKSGCGSGGCGGGGSHGGGGCGG